MQHNGVFDSPILHLEFLVSSEFMPPSRLSTLLTAHKVNLYLRQNSYHPDRFSLVDEEST